MPQPNPPEVATIHPHLNSLQAPSAIRNLKGWVCWRFEYDQENTKPRKVPFYTNGKRRSGQQGGPQDREQLTTFDAAKAAAVRKGYDGVGLALMPEFNIVALDFDHCVNAGGIEPAVESLITGTYAEFSPSGEGIRAFFRGDVGNNKSIDSSQSYGFETFSSKGFVTYTGNHTDTTTLMGTEDTVLPITPAVLDLCTKRFASRGQVDSCPLMTYEPPAGVTTNEIVEALSGIDPDTDHQTWLNVGMAIHHETQGEGFDLWCAWSALGSKFPGKNVLQKRWASFGQAGGRQVTIRTLLKLAQDQIASDSDFDAVVEVPADVKPLKFPVQSDNEFSQGNSPQWIIKGVLPKAELVVLFGESGSGKSFLALDMAASITRGLDWRGHRTKKGSVVYLAAEGGGGFRKRLTAYAQHHEIDLSTLDLSIIHATPNFLEKTDAVEIARSVASVGQVDVVIVDTFAQVMPGANENASDDMGRALAHCRGIHRATGAVVILVHHAGKDSTKGARGWSGLRAAADAEIEVIRAPMGRMARVSKQKDGEDGLEWGFDLLTIAVGMDEDGDVIESCVVVEAALPVMGKAGKKPMGKWERLVMEVVGEMAVAQTTGLEIDAIIDESAAREPAPEGGRDTRKQRARRALLALCDGDDAPYFLENDCVSVL